MVLPPLVLGADLNTHSLFFLLCISATGEKPPSPSFPILQGYRFELGFLLTWLSISLGGTTMRTGGCLIADLLLALVAFD